MLSKKINQTTLNKEQCPICQSTSFHIWRWSGLEQCSNCTYICKVNVDNELNFNLQEQYFNEEFSVKDDFFTKFYERLNTERHFNLLKKFIHGNKILEVGVGHGHLLKHLQLNGFEVCGIDLSKDVTNFVKNKLGLPIYQGTIVEIASTMPKKSFDAIITCHTFEHVDNLKETLASAKELLKDNGILYLAVPNIYAWETLLPGWTGYEPYHLHYFNYYSLEKLLESSNFKVVCKRTFEPISGWFNAIIKTLYTQTPNLIASKKSNLDKKSSNTIIVMLYNLIRFSIGLLITPIRYLQSILGYGEELIVITKLIS